MASLDTCSPVYGQQLAFEQNSVGNAVEFSYRYLGLERRPQSLRFRLPGRDVEAAMQDFRDYSLGGLNRHIDAEIEAAGRALGVRTRFAVAANGGRSVQFEGSSERIERLQRELPAVLQRARGEYLRRYLRLNEGDYVFVDYIAAVRQAMAVLAPLASALKSQVSVVSDRGIVEAALVFLQTIPYDDFTDVGRFGGVDFAPSAAMLKLNAGDCDSKSVALAALVRLLLPQRSTAIVRVDAVVGSVAHALAFVDLAQQPGDTTLSLAGRPYVALEASSPQPAGVGIVDARVEDRLRRGRIVATEVGR